MVGWYGKGYIALIFSKNPANFEEPSESRKMCLRNYTPLFSCLLKVRLKLGETASILNEAESISEAVLMSEAEAASTDRFNERVSMRATSLSLHTA